MNIAVIPARGGSKRIPRKNIKDFLGKPMIAWSIKVAEESGLFNRIIVSTDDEEIANIATKHGAEVPFIRPEHLSNDFVGTTPVVGHAAKWAMTQNQEIAAICCIYATAPFLLADDLVRGWEALSAGDSSFAISVTEFSSPIFRSFKKSGNGGLEMFFPEHFETRSQDLPSAFHDAAQFYWGTPSAWLENKKLFGDFTKPVLIPRWRVQDIDSMDDWRRAETIAPLVMTSSA